MEELDTTTAANRGSRNKKQRGNCTSNAHSQRQQIFEWLMRETLTTLQARRELDIMNPAARVGELRKQGHNIQTHWTTDDNGKYKHRVACYVLLVGAV